jgi:hypothetical protein
MQGNGYLAIWSDLTPQNLTDWAHWMTREHGIERVGVSGFLACRIFRALGAAVNRYFILYELEDERVVSGPDYLARLNAPTPWSQRIMPLLGNFARGGGRIAASAGTGQRRAVVGCGSGGCRTGETRSHHRRARPAHGFGADLDQDHREGHARQ